MEWGDNYVCGKHMAEAIFLPLKGNKSKYVRYTHPPSYKYTAWAMLQQHFVKY